MMNKLFDAEKSLMISGKNARYFDFSANVSAQKKPSSHFYGGNGFAIGCYLPFLERLQVDVNLTALALRGYWLDKPTANKLTREEDADVLIEFLEKTQDKPIIGMGHSQGATATAIAAAKRPELFSKLYLIEPVTFTKAQTWVYNLLPRALKMTQEPFKSTQAKQNDWQSVADYLAHLRALKAFRRIDDKHLQIFAEHSLTKTDNGYQLIFEPKQELANYFGTPFIDDALKALSQQQLPFTLILGKPTLFVSQKVRNNWQHFISNEQIITLNDFGHLLPMEAPEICAKLILKDDQSFLL
ncbi:MULTISPECIES: alpha/beta fold hydrolase [Psychrobacter]|uniref:alpha/beta fold hydrolase n=1 Tax=Psychrobacter TaxID=497 RepID=UPI001CB6DC65|nr:MULTISPECIES: alpha/beta hydrolase [Psychrobacter]